MTRLSENTSLPLKIVVPLIVAVAGAAWAISVQISGLRAELASTNRQLLEVNAKIEGAWSVQNMGLWVAKMQRDNPTMRVPNAREGFESR
jgi:hypothetical protein